MEDETKTSSGSCELLERYVSHIAGQLGCWNRLVLTGALLEVGYSGALEKRLQQDHIRCFELKKFAQPLRQVMRDHALKPPRASGLEVEFIRRKNVRTVVGRDGNSQYKVSALKKSLYSPDDLKGLTQSATMRYLTFISPLEDRSSERVNLDRITSPVKDQREYSWRGFNFFAQSDENVLLSVLRGEHQIGGMSNRLLQRVLPEKTGGQIGRILKRLRLLGPFSKIGHTYKCYLTALGQTASIAALKIKEHILLPALAEAKVSL